MKLDELIKALQRKEENAFEALYEMYCDSLFGVICNIVRDDAVAQEILQDVFMKIWKNALSYDEKKGRFFTWILKIARNAAIDKTRSQAFKKSNENIDVQTFADIIPSSQDLDNQTDSIGIVKFVKALSEKCKKVIELLYFKGYTQQEVSDTLNIPLGTVKTRNRTCIGQLRINLL